MKSILYIMRYRDKNLRQKIDGQISAFKELGYSVEYFILKDDTISLVKDDDSCRIKKVLFSSKSFYHHSVWYFDIIYSVIKILRRNVKYEFIYIREMPLGFFRWKLYREIHLRKIPLIVEIPTYIQGKYEKHRRLFIDIALRYVRRWNKVSAKYVTLFTLIGDSTTGSYYNRPAINIQNGADVSQYRAVMLNHQKDCINLVSVSTLSHWHGYDRLIRGLANYKETDYKVVFHIIGDGIMSTPWSELTKELNVNERVKFHGPLYGKELESFLDICDVGIGSLGLYRNGILQASILKAREYM